MMLEEAVKSASPDVSKYVRLLSLGQPLEHVSALHGALAARAARQSKLPDSLCLPRAGAPPHARRRPRPRAAARGPALVHVPRAANARCRVHPRRESVQRQIHI
jgi:hypothetical protein